MFRNIVTSLHLFRYFYLFLQYFEVFSIQILQFLKIFKISNSHCLHLLYRSEIDFHLLTLYPSTRTGVLKSPTVIVDFSISVFRSVNFYFIYFETQMLGIYTSNIVMSSWRTASCSLRTNFCYP